MRILLFLTVLCTVVFGMGCDKNSKEIIKQKHALDFDGIDDIVVIDHPSDEINQLSDAFTIEAWIYPRSISNNTPRIFERADSYESYSPHLYLTLVQSDSCLGIDFNSYFRESAGKVTLNKWQHIAVTFHEDILTFYINGIKSGQSMVFSTLNMSDSAVVIGGELYGTYRAEFESQFDRQFDGLISDVRLWNVARTAKQIHDSKDETLTGGEAGLIANWLYSEGDGQMVKDRKNLNDGHLGLSDEEERTDPNWFSE